MIDAMMNLRGRAPIVACHDGVPLRDLIGSAAERLVQRNGYRDRD